jgi:two-component system sensor histidine kinase/response regulator
MKPTILCVDDENDNLDALERLFRSRYKVLKADSGFKALEILDQYPDPVAVILTDQRMPEMTGVELLSKTIEKHPDTVRMLLTGYTDIQSVVEAVNAGQIYRYLTKPWDPIDLMNTVDRAVERFQMTTEIKEKNEALSNALAELKSLDQAKTQFMILINHELKTPLTSMLSFSELLRETHLNEEQELCLSRIYKSALRLKNLVDDVLLVVAGETKSLKIRIHPYLLSEQIVPLNSETQALIKQKRLKLEIDFLIDKKIAADASYINQVLSRLIHNAAKFSIDEAVIDVGCELVANNRMKLLIRNIGQKISPTVIEKIMKPFFIDEDVMNHSVGMGLGLTICQSILRAHGSSLQVENTSDGVLVSFELPCI